MANSIFIWPGMFTFNGSGVVFTYPILLPDGTAAAPSLAFASRPGLGWHINGAGGWTLSDASTDFVSINSNNGLSAGVSLGANFLMFGTSPGNPQTFLTQDAANTLAQRNGANAQLFKVYNTYTDATTFEALEIGPNAGGIGAGTFGVITTKGTVGGSSQALTLGSRNGTSVNFQINSANVWQFNSTGNLVDLGSHTLTVGSRISAGGLTPDASGAVGTPVVVGGPAQRKVAATAAQTIGSFTVGAADATFDVSANILITTATAHSFNVTVAYTDEGNTSRTVTLNFSTLLGVISNAAITQVAGAVPYEGVPIHIRAKAATTITVATTGTFTTVTYNGEGFIKQTA